ncbi:centromere protein H [Melopsittacus undulatus]|uniref:Centromere protein H C-terminal domain-containing protein n=1 Tax=Melopsittacus undulatus TaxID=13146 RepID=A0A8C6JUS5_MELUD|nr:centromere protein H [Melopsittacus undulatus]
MAEGGQEQQPSEDRERAMAAVDVFYLLRVRDQMKQQLLECSAVADADKAAVSHHAGKERPVQIAIEDYKKGIENEIVSFWTKTLALQRIQITAALRDKMKQNDNDSQLILEAVQDIVKLSEAIAAYQQQAREKEQKVADIQRQRLLLKKVGREKLKQIHDMMRKLKETQATGEVKTLEEMHTAYQKERKITSIIQNVLQCIIIGSRVNWAEDPSLKAVVLQLEKNI